MDMGRAVCPFSQKVGGLQGSSCSEEGPSVPFSLVRGAVGRGDWQPPWPGLGLLQSVHFN